MKRWIPVFIVLAGLGGWFGWRVKQKQGEAIEQVQQKERRQKAPALVGITEVALRDMVQDIEAVGTVESPSNVQVAAKIAGRIMYLQVREGDPVKRGQVLVRLDPSQLEAQVRQQEATVAEARSRLAQVLLGQAPNNANITTQIRQQEAAVASAKADYEQTKARYDADIASASGALTEANARYMAARTNVNVTEANIRNAEANLENTKSRYNRLLNLLEKGFVAAQLVDDARTAVTAQQTAVDVAKAQRGAAMAQRDSNLTLRTVAEKQVEIVKLKGPADLQASAAKLEQAKAALELAKANTAQKPAYQQNIAALRANLLAAEANLKNIITQRAEAVLISSLDGYVTARSLDVGAMASPGQAILTVQEFRDVWVAMPLPEEASRKVRIGQTASITFDALPGKNFSGKTVQVNPSSDPNSRQFMVRVLLSNAQNMIKPGMFARVKILMDRTEQVVAIPKEALQQRPEGKYVIVVGKDNVARFHPIVVGASDSDYTAIPNGLEVGDKIVVLSASPVKEGQEVKVDTKKPEATPAEKSAEKKEPKP